MKKIHKVAWKFRTQNLVATYALNLRKNLQHFSKSILVKPYIFQRSRSQKSNATNGVQIKAKIRKLCTFEANWLEKDAEFEIHSTFRT